MSTAAISTMRNTLLAMLILPDAVPVTNYPKPLDLPYSLTYPIAVRSRL